MGVFETLFTNGPLGCAQDFGTAYVYGSGNQASSNNYNISPGQPNSAWRVPVTQADCNTQYAAVGGGPSGFGILEDLLSGQTIYHRFDAATQKFDTPPVVVASRDEQQAALSQDGAGGIYGTYVLGGVGGPVTLSYSADGGKSWSSGTLDSDSDGASRRSTAASTPRARVGQPGSTTDQCSRSRSRRPTRSRPLRSAAAPRPTGRRSTLNVTCASFPCTMTIVLTAPENVVVHASSASVALNKHKRTKHKTVTLGKGKFTIKSKGSHKLAVKLSPAGKKFVRSHSGRVKVRGAITELVGGHSKATTKTIALKIIKSKRHHHRK